MNESIDELNQLLQIINGIRKGAGRAELQQLLPDQKLQQDLELDSLELAEMTVLIESKFGVDVFEDGIVTTVQDVIDRIQSR
jgi:acyl carrier protein